jgi:hypothetical protein
VKLQLIHDFKLQKIGMDFMGYDFKMQGSSYHHLIVPRRKGGLVTYENGAILMQATAHDYLHTIERYDLDLFNCITLAMQNQKEKERIDIDDLKYIKDCLQYFENHYSGLTTKKGKPIIKKMYITKRKV